MLFTQLPSLVPKKVLAKHHGDLFVNISHQAAFRGPFFANKIAPRAEEPKAAEFFVEDRSNLCKSLSLALALSSTI